MKGTKELSTNKGITLIALVITIIVMLILVGVTISMAVNGGLFNYAGKAVGDTNAVMQAEKELADGRVKIGEDWYNSIDEYLDSIKGEQGVKLINFTIDGVTYQAEEGMTYEQWINSSYNTTGKTFTRTTDGYFVTTKGDEMFTWWSLLENDPLYGGGRYNTEFAYYKQETGALIEEGNIITLDPVGWYDETPDGYFWITVFDWCQGLWPSYCVKEGMTWSQFIASELNVGPAEFFHGFYLDNESYVCFCKNNIRVYLPPEVPGGRLEYFYGYETIKKSSDYDTYYDTY